MAATANHRGFAPLYSGELDKAEWYRPNRPMVRGSAGRSDNTDDADAEGVGFFYPIGWLIVTEGVVGSSKTVRSPVKETFRKENFWL